MDGLVWFREPAGAHSAFGIVQQQSLLLAALECGGATVSLETVSAAQPPVNRGRWNFAIAIGSSSETACEWLARRAALRLAEDLRGPAVDTLILVVPALCERFFVVKDKPYQHGALALQAVGRVVVLVCGRDATASTELGGAVMGRVGTGIGSDPRVQAIDISSLIETHSDSAYGALCSCEAVGLIRRLAMGVTLDAALLGRAKLMSRDQI